MSAGQSMPSDRGMSEQTTAARPAHSQEAKNKEIVRRAIEEIWDKGNFALVDELYAAHYVDHTPLPEIPSNRQGIKETSSLYHKAFPDLRITVEDLVAEGDRVCARFVAQGTHKGELQGIPPTGKPTRIMGFVESRLEGGKVVESWDLTDQFTLLQQLGVLPQSP